MYLYATSRQFLGKGIWSEFLNPQFEVGSILNPQFEVGSIYGNTQR
jgi:hypothetical protein